MNIVIDQHLRIFVNARQNIKELIKVDFFHFLSLHGKSVFFYSKVIKQTETLSKAVVYLRYCSPVVERFNTRCAQMIGQCFPDLRVLALGGRHLDVTALAFIGNTLFLVYIFIYNAILTSIHLHLLFYSLLLL